MPSQIISLSKTQNHCKTGTLTGVKQPFGHCLVVSWVRWKGKLLDRPGKPKPVVRVNWERLDEVPVRETFNSHLRQSFSCITVEVRNQSGRCSKLLLLKLRLGDAAFEHPGGPVVREAVRLKMDVYVLSQGTPEAVARYRQARRTAASAVTAKTEDVGGVWRGYGEGLSVGTKVFLENHLTPKEGETGNHPSCI